MCFYLYLSLKRARVSPFMMPKCRCEFVGVFLPKLCEVQGTNARRGMAELKSSGIVAPGPVVHSVQFPAIPPEPFSPMEFAAEPAATPSYPPY